MAWRVALVDDHELVRAGLRLAFDRAADFEVVAESGSIADAVQRIPAYEPDVVTIDIRLPDGSGLDLAHTLRRRFPQLGIVTLTMYAGDEHLFAALDAGSNAFVEKSAPVNQVVAAARNAAQNPASFTADDLAGAMQRRQQGSAPDVAELSPRELDVLMLLAKGYGAAQAARRLGIAESTAKTHIAKLYRKLGAGNRAQAIMAAMRSGLIEAD